MNIYKILVTKSPTILIALSLFVVYINSTNANEPTRKSISSIFTISTLATTSSTKDSPLKLYCGSSDQQLEVSKAISTDSHLIRHLRRASRLNKLLTPSIPIEISIFIDIENKITNSKITSSSGYEITDKTIIRSLSKKLWFKPSFNQWKGNCSLTYREES